MKKTIIKLFLILSLIAYPLSAEYKVITTQYFPSAKKFEKIINDMVEKGYEFVEMSHRENWTLLIFKK